MHRKPKGRLGKRLACLHGATIDAGAVMEWSASYLLTVRQVCYCQSLSRIGFFADSVEKPGFSPSLAVRIADRRYSLHPHGG